jgi:protein-disulfide isomerase
MRSFFASVLMMLAVITLEVRADAPAIDKQKLEVFLRFAEGYAPSVKFVIGDPEPTSVPGYFKVQIHLSTGESKLDKVYYITADGKLVTAAPVWDVNQNPFAESAKNLTTVGPSFGPANAKVVMIVFSDFQCPYCREFARTIRENVPKKYPNDVRVIFHNFPLESIHPWAKDGAEAADCVGAQGNDAFWAFHDWIFEHQGDVNTNNVREKTLAFAQTQKLNTQKLTACLDSHAFRPEVEANIKRDKELGLQQTPTFYVNGRVVPGALPWPALDTLIQMELNRPAFIPPVSIK